MARVHTAKASKDYPDKGILKGQTYFYWQIYKQPKQMSLTRPKPSQLTGSSKLSAVYAANETFEEQLPQCTSPGEIVDALNELKEAIEEVANEYRESASNMEEAFPNGNPTIEMCNDNADQLEGYVSEIDDAITEIENLDATDFIDEDSRRADAASEAEDRFEGDGDYVENEEEVDAIYEYNIAAIQSFEDLDSAEQGSMMDDARDKSSSLSCPL